MVFGILCMLHRFINVWREQVERQLLKCVGLDGKERLHCSTTAYQYGW